MTNIARNAIIETEVQSRGQMFIKYRVINFIAERHYNYTVYITTTPEYYINHSEMCT